MDSTPKFLKRFLGLLVIFLLSACSGPGAQSTPGTAPLTVRVAYTSDKGLADIPSLMAQQRLSTQGYVFQPTFYTSGELAVAALAQGQADIAYAAPSLMSAASSQGAKVKWVASKLSNTFLVAGINKIQTCADLSGERLGIHSLGSPNTALINSYISQKCPGTQPQIIVVSGSDNRATALLAGQLDAGLLEIADWVQLDAKAPGKFHIIFNFAQDLPDIVITGMYVSDDFAAKHPVAVKDYLRANLQVNRDIAQDHSILLNEAASQLDIGAAQLKPVVEEYMQLKAWDVNGGLTVEKVKANVDFVKTLEGTDPNITPENAADLSYLNAVLDEIGRK